MPHSSCRKASQEPQPRSEKPVAGKKFRQDVPATLTPTRGHSTRITGAKAPRRCKNLRHQVPHAPQLSLTRRCERARDSFSDLYTSSPESPTVDLLAYVPGFLIQHLHLHFFLCFVSNSCTFLGFLDFPTPNNIYRILRVVLPPLAPCSILQISYRCDLLLFGFYGYQRFNLFSHFSCIYYYHIGEISCIPLLHSSIQICIHYVCCPDR